jgi:hypothetical protein
VPNPQDTTERRPVHAQSGLLVHLLLDLEDLLMNFADPVVDFEVLLVGVVGALLKARTDFVDLRIDSEVRLLNFEHLLANSEYL